MCTILLRRTINTLGINVVIYTNNTAKCTPYVKQGFSKLQRYGYSNSHADITAAWQHGVFSFMFLFSWLKIIYIDASTGTFC